ncbi:RHS repeat-associated core domain-containing protein [[Pseudomonas] boreopolis]|uniref:RHS repeat-associated core domain-containing protein n=1 Tax=Xanthomonas boreopolis TaxID=86183 RepID=UPI003DA0C27A
MSIAAKHFDPQLGIDIHMYAMPPCPLPTPHIGLVLDPFDYLPFIGSTVKVGGVHRATAGTGGLDIHIPLGAWAPPMAAPMGPQFDGEEIFMGSRTVSADGEPFSRLAMPVLDCNLVGLVVPFRRKKPKKPLRALSLPTGLNVAIPTNVTVGGPPTVSWTALAFRGLFAGLGKLRKASFVRKKLDAFANWRRAKWGNLPPGFLKCKVLRAEPVDIRDGSVSVTHEDFSIPGRLPLPWRRVYSSREAAHAGSCGHGWQTPADIRLQLSADGSAWLSGPDEAALFPQLPAGDGMAHHVLDFVDGARLYREGVHLLVRFKDGRRYRFEHAPAPGVAVLPGDRTLPIARIEDACGNHWRFERRDGHLVRIVESGIDGLQGRFIEVEARQGRIERLQLHDPATGLNHPLVSYRYAGGDLVAALDALDAARTFEYRQHRMVRHTDRVGLSFHYAYDAQWRVVHSWGDGGLYDYRFEYDDLLRETRLTDSLGHATVVKFDEHRLPLCEIDPLDGVTVFEYDDFGRTVAVTDPEGLRTGFEYDERGNVIGVARADGSRVRQAFDNADHVIEFVDAEGGRWRQTYDALERLVEQIDPLGGIVSYGYNEAGQVTSRKDERDAITTLHYDRYGLPSQMQHPEGAVVRYEFDALGRLKSLRDPLGAVTEFEYDPKGRVLAVHAGKAGSTRYGYDAEDQLIDYIDPHGARTRFTYEGVGWLTRRVNADSTHVDYAYDSEGRLERVCNQRCENYLLERDALGRVTAEVDYWGQRWHYEYDAAGRLRASLDPLGRRVEFRTDGSGRLLSRKHGFPNGSEERFSYDSRGNLVEFRNGARWVKRRFDALGRLIEESQDGFKVQYGYDLVGNLVKRETSTGNRIDYGYDLDGNVVSVRINEATPISIQRDTAGRVLCETLAVGVERRYDYREGRRKSSQALLVGGVERFSVAYSYDACGNLIRRNESDGGADEYRYDPVGRLLEHLDPQGRLERFITDTAGDRLETRIIELPGAQVAGGFPEPGSWCREGRLQGRRYRFDRVGNLVSRDGSRPGEETIFEWDPIGRLVRSICGGKVIEYGYDAIGRRVFKKCEGRTTWFFWEGETVLAEVVEGGNDQPVLRVSNPVDIGEWKRHERKLGEILAKCREYIYYPGTFVPLALIEPVLDHEDDEKSKRLPSPHGMASDNDARFRKRSSTGVPGSRARDTLMGLGSLGTAVLGGVRSVPVDPGISMPADTVVEESAGMAEAPVRATETRASVKIYHYHVDPNGAPTRLTDLDGCTVWRGRYEPWGRVEVDPASTVRNPLRFQGQYHDAETDLHYNRYRYYDPGLGQYLSIDPTTLGGGSNFYAYVRNPLGWIDPLGLMPWAVDGVTARIRIIGPDGVEADRVFKSVPRVHHAEVNGLKWFLNDGDGFEGKHVVISDVIGSYVPEGPGPAPVCNKCRADIFDYLQQGRAASVTLPVTIGKEVRDYVTIDAKDFGHVSERMRQLRDSGLDNNTKAKQAWEYLMKYSSCRK